jgi:hypothetical protein
MTAGSGHPKPSKVVGGWSIFVVGNRLLPFLNLRNAEEREARYS